MNRYLTTACVALALCFDGTLLAQEKSDPNIEPQSQDPHVQASPNLNQDLRNRFLEFQLVPQFNRTHNFTVDLVPLLRPFRFSSADGHYAAQNAEEIKAYQDLKMTFRFIEEPFLRKQLRLPDDEGLIVLEAHPEGEGYQNGFRDGDIVLKVDEKPVDTQYDFVIELANDRGEPHAALLRRDGEPLQLKVVLSTPDASSDERYQIGIAIEELSDLTRSQLGIEGGVGVGSVNEDSPAAQAGLAAHDVIVRINGTTVNNSEELRQAVAQSGGQPIELNVLRKGEQIAVLVQPQKIDVEVEGVNLNLDIRPVEGLSLESVAPDYVRVRGLASLGQAHVADPNAEAHSAASVMSKLSELESKIDRLIELIGQK